MLSVQISARRHSLQTDLGGGTPVEQDRITELKRQSRNSQEAEGLKLTGQNKRKGSYTDNDFLKSVLGFHSVYDQIVSCECMEQDFTPYEILLGKEKNTQDLKKYWILHTEQIQTPTNQRDRISLNKWVI